MGDSGDEEFGTPKRGSVTSLLKKTPEDNAIRELVRERGYKRQAATKACKKVKEGNLSEADFVRYIEKLSKLHTELRKLDHDINSHMLNESYWTVHQHRAQCFIDEELLEDIDTVVAQLKLDLKQVQDLKKQKLIVLQQQQQQQHQQQQRTPDSDDNASFSLGPLPNPHFVQPYRLTLPHLTFPKFDGRPENYNRFITSFETIVDKLQLSTYQKYLYLVDQLSGNAKKIVDPLTISNPTYEAAKDLLNRAFSDTRSQQFAVIEKLCSLKLESSAEDAFAWISDATSIKNSVDRLDIKSEHFIQYFLLKGLCPEFKLHLTAVTNQSRPSVSLIMDNAFEVNRRFLDSQLCMRKIPTSTASYGSEVKFNQTKTSGCTLCNHDKDANAANHKLSKCTKYADASSKISKLKAIKGCTKCGSSAHEKKSCKFKFSRSCNKCKKWHMSYLCTSPVTPTKDKDKDEKEKPKSQSTQNHLASVSYNVSSLNDVVLPTATVYYETNGSSVAKRLLKDSGSQSTFVQGSVSDLPECSVLDDTLKLTVKGINGPKTYSTKQVEFAIKVPGLGSRRLKAICLPEIATNLSLPNIDKIVDWFVSKGYVLADKNLGNQMDNVSIILGSDQSFVLPLTSQKEFGPVDSPSTYFETPAGVALSGSIQQMLRNLDSLPLANTQ